MSFQSPYKWEFNISKMRQHAPTLRELKKKLLEEINKGEIMCLTSENKIISFFDVYEVTSLIIKKKKEKKL